MAKDYIERKKVESSNLKAVGYDEEKEVLAIEFKNGSIYYYYEVPKTVYFNLIEADSVGAFLARRIKGIYDFKKIQSED